MITANKVPDTLVELISAGNENAFKLGAINRLCNSIIAGRKYEGTVSEDTDKTSWLAAEAYYGAVLQQLPKSTIYYADEHMGEVIEMAAAVMDNTDLADTSTIVAPNGFCYFANGIRLTENMVFHGLSWTRLKDDMYFITTWNDAFEELDSSGEAFRGAILEHLGATISGRWSYASMSQYVHGDPLRHTDLTSAELEELGFELMGSDLMLPNHFFHALMLLLNQPPQIVTLTDTEMTHKKHIKRAKEAKVSSTVTVIDMRHRYESKPKSEPTGDKAFEYSRRWLVSGHWRWQPMKDSETKEWVRKRIWINPHTKGPDDKPFVATKKVFALLK